MNLYIGNKNSVNNLSDAELADQHTVKIADNSYDINSTQISVALGDNFYAIKGIIFDSSGANLSPAATDPVVTNNLSLTDISAIFVDSQSLNLDNIDKLFFIIGGNRYELSDLTVDASGNFTVNSTTYPPGQVTMVIDNSFYKMNDAKSYNSKFIFYCTDSDVSTWSPSTTTTAMPAAYRSSKEAMSTTWIRSR